jgi:hypothetical protein
MWSSDARGLELDLREALRETGHLRAQPQRTLIPGPMSSASSGPFRSHPSVALACTQPSPRTLAGKREERAGRGLARAVVHDQGLDPARGAQDDEHFARLRHSACQWREVVACPGARTCTS